MEQTANPYTNQSITTSTGSSSTSHSAIRLLNGETIKRALNDIYSSDYELKRDIPITLQYKGKSYILIQDELNIGAEDNTLQGVERKLAIQIIKLYKKLSNLPESTLGPYPKKLLSYLKEYIV